MFQGGPVLTSLGDDIAFLRGKFSAAGSLFRGFLHEVPQLGLVGAAIVFTAEASTRRPLAALMESVAAERLKFRPAGYRHPVTFRRVGTDTAVLRQMLVSEEYRPVAALRNVRLIVDCGANIGISAYYLLHCYPDARLIALEPDAENCALCRRNLAPFSDRSCVIQAAIWPENQLLRVVPSSRNQGSWALRVERWEGGEVEGLTMQEILHRAGLRGPIDLLKVDIEGAEEDVFRDAPGWLGMTRNIAIELHGEAAEASFAHALADYHYLRRRAHELTIIYGLRRAAG